MELSVDSILHPSRDAAREALAALGGHVLDACEMTVEHPILGTWRRCFAVIPNVLTSPPPADPVLFDQLAAMVHRPENVEILNRLSDRALPYTPLNKRTVRRLAPLLHRCRVHLPWAFRPMNFDFGVAVEDAGHEGSIRFQAYYNRAIDVAPDGHLVVLKRVFSLPVRGSGHGTWQEPIFDEMLDVDVGMFIEANVAVEA